MPVDDDIHDIVAFEMFLAKVEAILESRGMTSIQMCENAGLPPARLIKWKHGHGGPSLTHIVRIAEALGVTPGELLS